MPVLSEEQVRRPYFELVGGSSFPRATELEDYDGGKNVCIACTQLPDKRYEQYYFGPLKCYTPKEQKAIVEGWIGFLSTHTDRLEAIHFNSYVPQRLFDAACCQKKLKELRIKWGGVKDLSGLKKLPDLRYLYLGSCKGLKSFSDLSDLRDLAVLNISGTRSFTDYSPLSGMTNLEQLMIEGCFSGGTVYVDDIDFLLKMPNLRAIGFGGVRILKKYTAEELREIRRALPGLYDMGDSVFKGIR